MIKYEDLVFQIIVSIQDPMPPELRRKFNVGPLEQGLYCMKIWEKGNGKVLNLIWNSVGATPEVVTFRREGCPLSLRRQGIQASFSGTRDPRNNCRR